MKKVYAGSVNGSGSVSGSGEGIYTIYLNDDYTIDHYESIYSENSGIITIHQDRGIIYAANESRDFNHHRGAGGGISAYRIDNDHLEKINDSLSYGSKPSYVSVSEDGRYLAVSNHGSHSSVVIRYVQNEKGEFILQQEHDDSSIALFELLKDGSIGKLLDLKVFKGHGYWMNGGQECSFLHSVKIKRDLVFACNRGTDEIEVMKINNNQLKVVTQYPARKGLAPRHLDFHPSKNIIYVCNENYPCVSVYQYDLKGNMQELQTIESIENFEIPDYHKDHCDLDEYNDTVMGGNRNMYMPADIHASKDGKFVYVSNRHFIDQGSITSYIVNEDGTLIMNQFFKLEGKDPRGFNLLNDQYLIVGLIDINMVYIYQLNNGRVEKEIDHLQINAASSFIMKE